MYSERCFTPSGPDLKAGSSVSDSRDQLQDDCNLLQHPRSWTRCIWASSSLPLALAADCLRTPWPRATLLPLTSLLHLRFARPSTSEGTPADLPTHTNPTSSSRCSLSRGSLPVFFALRWLLTHRPRRNPSAVL